MKPKPYKSRVFLKATLLSIALTMGACIQANYDVFEEEDGQFAYGYPLDNSSVPEVIEEPPAAPIDTLYSDEEEGSFDTQAPMPEPMEEEKDEASCPDNGMEPEIYTDDEE